MSSTYLLATSLLLVILAPAAARLAGRSAVLLAATDSFVATTVGTLALVHILPHAYRVAGPPTLAAVALGALLPIGLHLAFHRFERRAMPVLLWLVLGALAFHAILDGAALAAPRAGGLDGALHAHPATASLLGAAVVLHRFPMVLGIWWFARPRLGRHAAIALLAAIGIGTITGYVAAGLAWAALGSRPIALLQAMIAGMLFHVLIGHQSSHDDRAARGRRRLAIVAGTAAGVGVMMSMAWLGTLELPASSPLSTAITVAASVGVAAYVLQARWRQRREHAHHQPAHPTC